MEEREEGELSEGELSEISSEEEYLLRQRLEVLESYNNVLERKDRRRRSDTSRGHTKNNIYPVLLPDLSEISGSDLENSIVLNVQRKKETKRVPKKEVKVLKNIKKKTHIRKASVISKTNKNYEKLTKHKVLPEKECIKRSKVRSHKEKHRKSTVTEIKVINESSDDTDYEYRNKRRKLQHSVQISSSKTDCTTLKMRLMNMLTDKTNSLPDSLNHLDNEQTIIEKCEDVVDSNIDVGSKNIMEPIVVSTDEDLLAINNSSGIVADQSVENNKSTDPNNVIITSDDDLELLRQNALQTKLQKPLAVETETVDHISDSEDSDELRLICLRSTLLKKAMEMKQKKKMRKRMATISSIDDFLSSKLEEIPDTDDAMEHNNTDIESVDMEIGISDSPDAEDNVIKDDDKVTKIIVHQNSEAVKSPLENCVFSIHKNVESPKQDELSTHLNENSSVERNEDLEDDEDLLRTKLLTSLSRNLCKTDNKMSTKTKSNDNTEKNESTNTNKNKEPDTKKFIINIGESSGSDDEATKNLTKMHMKLSENVDFQHRLDLFLKTARMETENNYLPNVEVQKLPPAAEKFVPKTVNHLPKSGQIEYKRLVKRMAELERLKQNRQATLNSSNITSDRSLKITRKDDESRPVQKVLTAAPIQAKRIIQPAPDLETHIALSRKRIAAESTKVLRLKEESKLLVQQHRLAVAELQRVRSAMFANRREERSVQTSLAAMRNQHQLLLKRLKIPANKITNNVVYGNTYKKIDALKCINESKKTKLNLHNPSLLQSLKVSVSDPQEKKYIPVLSVQLDLSNNKKTVTLPKKIPSSKEFIKHSNNEEKEESTTSLGSEIMHQRIETTLNVHISEENTAKSAENVNSESKDIPDIKGKSRQETTSTEVKFIDTDESVKRVTDVMNDRSNNKNDLDDYNSPLTAMKFSISLEADSNGILCPFEVGGTCKDAGCKYVHPKVEH